jgi:hypothetical protein
MLFSSLNAHNGWYGVWFGYWTGSSHADPIVTLLDGLLLRGASWIMV